MTNFDDNDKYIESWKMDLDEYIRQGEPDHTAFAENSWYFRNALVRANYNDVQNGVHQTSVFLERFFENLLAGAHHELKNRFMHIDYDESKRQTTPSAVTDQDTDQDTDQVSAQVTKLLSVMDDAAYSANELIVLVGIKHRPTFRVNYLNPALEAGVVERTIPDKPRSGNQKYRKTRR